MNTRLVLSFALAAAAFALPVVAQERVTGDVIRVEAPTLSETNSARSEWYRQFSEGKPPESRLQWQAEPNQDFSVQIGKDSRWQLNLDKVTRPGQTYLPREEVQAGATFRITPRLSVGGEVRIGAEELDSSNRWENQEVEAGIRLKSAFKF
ncbi:MAG: NtrZ family periplasmic regulatory protein [Hyphomonas sp.]